MILMITFVFSYWLVMNQTNPLFETMIVPFGYLGTFIAGIFFSNGFTAAPATAVIILLAQGQNIWITGIVAGLGALIGDLLIFRLIKISLSDEFTKLSHERTVRQIHHTFPAKIREHLLILIACFIIASPLPDEAGITILAATKKVSQKLFLVLSFILNTVGVYLAILVSQSFI